MKRLITFLSTMLLLLMLVPATAGAKTVYVEYTGSDTPKIHYWDGGTKSEWNDRPSMNVVSGQTNWYYYDINTCKQFIITGNNNQTKDRTFPEGQDACYLTYDGSKDAEPTVNPGIPTFTSELSKYSITYNDGTGTWKQSSFDDEGKLTVNLTKGDHEFKIYQGSTYYGNNGTMTKENCTGWNFSTSGGNAKINADPAGDYVFSITLNSDKSPNCL